MKRSSLGFCGIETTQTLIFGPVKDSSSEERKLWLQKTRNLGLSLRQGVRSPAKYILHKIKAWIRALRLQFYPMTWLAYTVGALGAAAAAGTWDFRIYLLGFGFLFFLEAATVFTNEWFDYETDLKNQHYGPFNGGSRILVDKVLTFRELSGGILLTLISTTLCIFLLLYLTGASIPLLILLVVFPFLALGYTVPPLQLSWRGFGELNVGLTHSLGAVLCGYLFLGGLWSDPFPWLVSIPLFLAILPAITLSGIPDLDADRRAGKETLAVLMGLKRAKRLAIALTVAAILMVICMKDLPALQGSFAGLLPFALPHGIILIIILYQDQKSEQRIGRLDGMMAVSLGFIIWFGLIPLLNLI